MKKKSFFDGKLTINEFFVFLIKRTKNENNSTENNSDFVAQVKKEVSTSIKTNFSPISSKNV